MDMEVSPLLALPHSPFLVVLLLLTLLVLPISYLLLFSSTEKLPPPSSCSDGRRRLPPSPRGLPVLGHLPLLGPLPHRKLRSLAQAHGPVMLLRFGRVPTVVASSAAAAQEVMKTRDLAFASRARVRMADRLLYGGRDMAFAPYGDYWRQARRVCVLHLLSARRVLSLRRVREQEVASMIDRVDRRRRRPPAAGPSDYAAVNLSDLLISYTNAVISRATFGDGEYGIRTIDGGGDEGGGKLRKVFADFEELLGTATVGEFVPWLAWVDTLTGLDAKATRTCKVMDGLLERVIADHRQRRLGGRRREDASGEDDHRDFVDVLLDVSETEEEAGGVRFDTVSIKAIILDMFAAATDTTYTTMVWTMAELINHPGEMRKLQDEIRSAVGGASHVVTEDHFGRSAVGGASHVVTEDHLGEMRYLRAVIKETLRLHAPLPLLLAREALEDTELLGHRVPVGTRVVINAWAIGRDPEAWERAEEFVPERFMVDDGGGGPGSGPEEYVQLAQDFRFVPFGAGRRGCPGVGFAAPSIELALASLLHHFDWELPAAAARGAAASKVDMSEQYGLSVRLRAALHLVAKPRIHHQEHC